MHKRTTLAAMFTIGALALTACAGANKTTTSSPAPTAAAGGVNLSGVCPATVTVQTDWYPEAEHGHLYQMLGTDYKIDAKHKSVSGPLMYKGKTTGVNLKINAGGPAIGYQLVNTQMYQNKNITLGYVGTDDAIQNSKNLPTTAVMAELNDSPFMIMWDPTKYPSVTNLSQLGAALKSDGGVVRYFSGSAYMKYLISKGIFAKGSTDGSYDGTPAKWVAGKGKDAQQGFASAEPYIYQHQVKAWDKPVKYALLSSTGWTSYASSMSVRTADLSKLSPCLTKLVPVMQQAEVDYMTNPAATNNLILAADHAYSKSWPYTLDVANYAVGAMKTNKIISDGSLGYIGGFDQTKVQNLINIALPIFKSSGTTNLSITPSDLFTNQFLDKSIKLGY